MWPVCDTVDDRPVVKRAIWCCAAALSVYGVVQSSPVGGWQQRSPSCSVTFPRHQRPQRNASEGGASLCLLSGLSLSVSLSVSLSLSLSPYLCLFMLVVFFFHMFYPTAQQFLCKVSFFPFLSLTTTRPTSCFPDGCGAGCSICLYWYGVHTTTCCGSKDRPHCNLVCRSPPAHPIGLIAEGLPPAGRCGHLPCTPYSVLHILQYWQHRLVYKCA